MSDAQYVPSVTSAGQPIVPMTDEQKYLFDLRGWILLPALLTTEECDAAREFLLKYCHNKESLPENRRHLYADPAMQVMLEHPVLMGILNEILSLQGPRQRRLLRRSI